MRIPLDFYRILGVPQQATEDIIEQAYQDRLRQWPRQPFSEGAIAVRNDWFTRAYETLGDGTLRQDYDGQWWGEVGAETLPELDCDPPQLIGALLILLDLGEYEQVIDLGEGMLAPLGGECDPLEHRSDYILAVALAHEELSQEYGQQHQYEKAATANVKALARLQQEDLFPDLQSTIRQNLYQLRPYRILELLTHADADPEAHRQGVDLLQALIQDRGGIDGKGKDYSGLGNDDFLTFIHQLRPHLTLEDQARLFLDPSPDPSAIAACLGVHVLLAQGLRYHSPAKITLAKTQIAQLKNCQDLALENAICELLLGQTDTLNQAIEQLKDENGELFLGSGDPAQDNPDLLIPFYRFTETWLGEELVPYFQGLPRADLSLKAYFNDPQVQHSLNTLSSHPADAPPVSFVSPLPPVPTESETPMVHSSATYSPPTDLRPLSKGRGKRRGSRSSTYTSTPSDASLAASSPQGIPLALNGSGLTPVPVTPLGESFAPKRRRRKKRVTINPLRFGLFLVGLAAVVGGGAYGLWQGFSPLNSLAPEPVEVNLDRPSDLIPDEATTKALLLQGEGLNPAVAQQVVQNWLDRKKLAFGETHDLKALDSILTGNLLAQQQNRVKQDQGQKRYRQYDHQLKILGYKPHPKEANRGEVTAQVQETTRLFNVGSGNPIGSPTQDKLTVKYQLVRDNGQWKINAIQVLP